MHRVAAWLLIAGCGGWLGGARHSGPDVLGPPWEALAGPAARGRVTWSQPDTLSVHHASGVGDDLLVTYVAALEADGWTAEDARRGARHDRVLTRGAARRYVAVHGDGEGWVVSVSVLPR